MTLHFHERRFVRLLISILIVLVLSLLAIPRSAQGQGIGYAPPASFFPQQKAIIDQQVVPEAPVDLDGSGYWIVSSRCRTPNVCCNNTSSSCFTFHQRVGCNPLIQRTSADLQAWLPPGIPVCVMVHGSFVSWELAVRDAHRTYHWLRRAAPHRPIRMIFYAWPSGDPRSLLIGKDVTKFGNRAEYNGIYLTHMINLIPPESPISLIGHSHGSRVVVSAMHLIGGGTVCNRYSCLCRPQGRRFRAIFAGAGIDHHWLNPGQRYRCALRPLECLLNLRNHHDIAMKLYPLVKPFSGAQMAHSGFKRRDLRRLGWQAQKIRELDVSRLLRMRHTWDHYTEQPRIACALVPYVYY